MANTLERDSLLTCSQLASRLNVKPSTIRAWTSRRKIPFLRLAGGRAVRYREADIRAIATLVPALRPLREAAPAPEAEGGER